MDISKHVHLQSQKDYPGPFVILYCIYVYYIFVYNKLKVGDNKAQQISLRL